MVSLPGAKERVRLAALQAKQAKNLTWEQIGKALGRSPVYTAMLVYGYGAATQDESEALASTLGLGAEDQAVFREVPYRTPAQPWPPTDPFVYRLYEAVMLYGPALKDVAHELFGDGIMSAIDMSIMLEKTQEEGNDRMVLTLNGKWLRYRKY
jgi:cyanate lyase